MAKYYYDPASKGFYKEGLHSQIPQGSIELTETQYNDLMPKIATTNEVYVENNTVKTRAIANIITWDAIRTTRDAKLTASDWTQLQDAPLSAAEKTAWTTYRQQLRDITTTYATPEAVVWPTAPSE